LEKKPEGTFSHPVLKELLEKDDDPREPEKNPPENPPEDLDFVEERREMDAKILLMVKKWNKICKDHKKLKDTVCKAVTGMERSSDKDKLIKVPVFGWFIPQNIANLDQFLKGNDFTKELFDKTAEPILMTMQKCISKAGEQNSTHCVDLLLTYFNYMAKFHDGLLQNYILNNKNIPRGLGYPKFENRADRDLLVDMIKSESMIMIGDLTIIANNIMFNLNNTLKSEVTEGQLEGHKKQTDPLVLVLKEKYPRSTIKHNTYNEKYEVNTDYLIFQARKAIMMLDSLDDFNAEDYKKHIDLNYSFERPYDLIYIIGMMMIIDTTNHTAYSTEVLTSTQVKTLSECFGSFCNEYEEINRLIDAL